MSTPAGWYDDGSGRQRWWDGQQWTEHFDPATPEVPASVEPPAVEQAQAGPSLVGWLALGAGVLGFITVCIPPVMILGWILLFAALVLSIVAFFLKGKKWAPIVGISLSVVGAIVGGILALVFFTAAFITAVDEIDEFTSAPSSTAFPSEDAEDTDADTDAGTGAGRPSPEEVAVGLAEIVASTGAEGYSEEHLLCFSEQFVASDMSDETLQQIASGEEMFEDPEAALAFAEEFAEAMPVCIS